MRKITTLSILVIGLLFASFVNASAASIVDFEVSQRTVDEDDGTYELRIRRTGDLSEPATVVLTAVDGTAGEFDFDAHRGTLALAPGMSEIVETFSIRDDSRYERTEWFSLRLSTPSPNMRLGSQHTMTVFIDDTDDYPRMGFLRLGMKVEPRAGRQVQALICIGPDHSSVEPTAVSFTTSDVTATAGTDYLATTATLTFEPFEWIKCTTITVLGDGQNEPRESFAVTLYDPVNAVVVPPATFTIINSVPYAQHIDFDGNGFADYSGYDPTAAKWFTHQYPTGIQFGTSTDIIVPADYTGDGQTDSAVWRPATGDWYVLRSEDGSYYSTHFGATGDIPVPADFDGDGIADFAVFRPTTGVWYIQRSSNGLVDSVRFGADGDRPTPADFDGDWKADLAIYRPNLAGTSQWWIRRSSDGSVSVTEFGDASDRTTVGDYTGDGKADIAVCRPTTGQWLIVRSEDQTHYFRQTGFLPGSTPAPGDYSGDGRSDYANFTTSNNLFNVWPSSDPTILLGGGTDPSATVPLAIVNVH